MRPPGRIRCRLPGLAAAVLLAACETNEPGVTFSGDPIAGRAALQKYDCGVCHRIPGVRGARGLVGPPLEDFGKRIYIAATRRLVTAALSGELDGAAMRTDANFGFEVPLAVAGIADQLLDPRASWSDPHAYDVAATSLAHMFEGNMRRLERPSQAAE